MKILIPLAGLGNRLKPFTLTKAKAMVEVAGKPVLGHILDSLSKYNKIKIDEVIFIIGYKGEQIKEYVEAKEYNFKSIFIEQKELMGQAHAVKMAEKYINSDILIWFVDTISDANLNDLSLIKDNNNLTGAIYVKEVSNPKRFGQVKEENGIVTEIKEKADPPISPLVNIGLYYVKDYKLMLNSIDELINNDAKKKGEFYLMDAFEIMISNGAKFKTLLINDWFDCGMPDVVLETNKYLLSKNSQSVSYNVKKDESSNVIINEPVFIHPTAKISNSNIGPYVSIGENVVISDSKIENSIIMDNCVIAKSEIDESIIGENSSIFDKKGNFIIGPYSKLM